MTITVKYFASLREQTGCGEKQIVHQPAMTILQIWQQSTGSEQPPGNVLCAINMEYARLDQIVEDNAEVAFFPPVTGG